MTCHKFDRKITNFSHIEGNGFQEAGHASTPAQFFWEYPSGYLPTVWHGNEKPDVYPFSWRFSLDRKPNLRRSVHALWDSAWTVLLYCKITPEHALINEKTRHGTGNGVKFSSDGNNTGRENKRPWERGWRVGYATFVKMIIKLFSRVFAMQTYMKVSWMILDKRPQKVKIKTYSRGLTRPVTQR